jgi:hypothetical protein
LVCEIFLLNIWGATEVAVAKAMRKIFATFLTLDFERFATSDTIFMFFGIEGLAVVADNQTHYRRFSPW